MAAETMAVDPALDSLLEVHCTTIRSALPTNGDPGLEDSASSVIVWVPPLERAGSAGGRRGQEGPEPALNRRSLSFFCHASVLCVRCCVLMGLTACFASWPGEGNVPVCGACGKCGSMRHRIFVFCPGYVLGCDGLKRPELSDPHIPNRRRFCTSSTRSRRSNPTYLG